MVCDVCLFVFILLFLFLFRFMHVRLHFSINPSNGTQTHKDPLYASTPLLLCIVNLILLLAFVICNALCLLACSALCCIVSRVLWWKD